MFDVKVSKGSRPRVLYARYFRRRSRLGSRPLTQRGVILCSRNTKLWPRRSLRCSISGGLLRFWVCTLIFCFLLSAGGLVEISLKLITLARSTPRLPFVLSLFLLFCAVLVVVRLRCLSLGKLLRILCDYYSYSDGHSSSVIACWMVQWLLTDL